MASANKNVTVLTPNGRRQNIKVSPNTTILQILEEVCNKQGFKSEEYDLKHHNNILDVSSIMRFSGLPNNAQLEMCPIQKPRAMSAVTLGLQLEDGTRLTGNFSPEENLMNILEQLCPNEIKLEANPVVIYMRQEIYGVEVLKATTLKKLGLTSGRAMLRLIHRQPEELHTQANVSTPLPSKPIEEKPFVRKLNRIEPESTVEPKKDPNISVKRENCINDFIKKEKARKTSDPKKIKNLKVKISENEPDLKEKEDPNLDNIVFLGERNALAFSLDMAETIPQDLPDEFFELTIQDAKQLLRDLKKKRVEVEESPLQTSAQRDLEENKRVLRQLSQYNKSVIRIKFPDRTVLQGTFKPIETIKEVKEFVKGFLEDNKYEFHLYTTPPKLILKSEMSLLEAACVPSAVVHFGTNIPVETNHRFLRESLHNQFTSHSIASLAAVQSRGSERKLQFEEPEDVELPDADAMQVDLDQEPSTSATQVTYVPVERVSEPKEKIPKWFKPNK